MSWLRQTVNSKLGSFKDQLNNILAEDDDAAIALDPEKELKVTKEKLSDQEKSLELLRNECNRLKQNENEITEKYLALEYQFELLNADFKRQLNQKDAQINELRQQVSSFQSLSSNKSPFMIEEFEEIMPSNELNDFIRLEKEIKRLQDDNKYLLEENERLRDETKTTQIDVDYQKYEKEVESLKNQLRIEHEKYLEDIFALKSCHESKNRNKKESLTVWKDLTWNNSEEIDLIETNYDELKIENAKLIQKIEELQLELVRSHDSQANLEMSNEQIQMLNHKIAFLESELERTNVESNEEIQLARQKFQEMELSHKKQIEDLNEKCESLKLSNSNTDDDQLKEKISDLNAKVEQQEKDSVQIKEQEQVINELTQNLNAMHMERSQLLFFLNQKNEESLTYYNEIQRLNETVMNLNQESFTLKDEYAALESEFQGSKKLTDELSSELDNLRVILSEYQIESEIKINIKQEKFNHDNVEIDNLNTKIDSLKFECKKLSAERDQALMDSKKHELNEKNLKEQLTKVNKELERLREHLVEMSENYTREAVNAETKEKELRVMLTQAEDTIYELNKKFSQKDQENQKLNDKLTKENMFIKDECRLFETRVKQAEDLYQTQLKTTKNLELVLERLQKDKDYQHTNEISKYQDTIKQNAVTIHNLQNETSSLKVKLNEMQEAVSAAARLNDKIDKNDETISYLQSKNNEKDEIIMHLQDKINEIRQINDSYIEKEIIKNLLIGYLKVPQNERKQVIRLMGSMLNFSKTDYDQLESNENDSNRWLGGFFGGTSRNASPIKEELSNKSFTDLLIQYVDRESKPKPRFSLSIASASDKKNDSTASIIQSSYQAQQINNPLLLNRNTLNRNSPVSTSASMNTSTSTTFLEDVLK